MDEKERAWRERAWREKYIIATRQRVDPGQREDLRRSGLFGLLATLIGGFDENLVAVDFWEMEEACWTVSVFADPSHPMAGTSLTVSPNEDFPWVPPEGLGQIRRRRGGEEAWECWDSLFLHILAYSEDLERKYSPPHYEWELQWRFCDHCNHWASHAERRTGELECVRCGGLRG